MGDFSNWDPMNLAESHSSEAQAQHIAVEHGRAAMASFAGSQLQEKHAGEKNSVKKQGFDFSAVASAMALTTAIAPTPAFATSADDFGGYTLPVIGTLTLTAIIAGLAGPVEEDSDDDD